MNKKQIFTFWEPKEKIFPYLELCIQTWRKMLPDYEIIILNYSNLEDYLKDDFIKQNIKKYSLPKQADILKCTILKENGGIFLDLDTIITDPSAIDILDDDTSDFMLFYPHICFIKAKKDSYILKRWDKKIKKRMDFYNKVMKTCFNSKLILKIFNRPLYKKLKHWGYFGNSILNGIIRKIDDEKTCKKLDIYKYNVFPELISSSPDKKASKNFQDFYFNNNYIGLALNKTSGLMFLHNSWVKKKYQKMTKKDFLNQDMTLSNILKKVL